MRITLGRSKFKMRILYKSGNSHSQWYTKFNTNQDLTSAEWLTADQNIKPVVMGISEVEAIYQEDYRVNLFTVIYANTIGLFIK
jgi:hypothetical protein